MSVPYSTVFFNMELSEIKKHFFINSYLKIFSTLSISPKELAIVFTRPCVPSGLEFISKLIFYLLLFLVLS